LIFNKAYLPIINIGLRVGHLLWRTR